MRTPFKFKTNSFHQDSELIPFPERVNANCKTWLLGAAAGREPPFSGEQLQWLERIGDHIVAKFGIEPEDFEYAPFAQEGRLGKLLQLFGERLTPIIDDLNSVLVA